jgi:anti-anti-sigma regulatory factor
VTVDLSGVEYLDSGGINVLFAHANDIHLMANPLLIPVLKISGLTDVASVESAGPQGD